jgi:hypothetical protein
MLPKTTVLFVIAILAVAAFPALAVHMDSQLTGDLGVLDLATDVTFGGSIWTYTYQLTFTTAVGSNYVHSFAVDNIGQYLFTNASNTGNFTNPTYDPNAWSVDWILGTMTPGQTVTFSYQSQHAPDVITVWATVGDSGAYASGLTLGMGAEIPEPGTILALSGMFAAAAGLWRRRR